MELLKCFFILVATMLALVIVEVYTKKMKPKKVYKTIKNKVKSTPWFSLNDRQFFIINLLSITVLMVGIYQFNFELISIGLGILFYAFLHFAINEPDVKDLL